MNNCYPNTPYWYTCQSNERAIKNCYNITIHSLFSLFFCQFHCPCLPINAIVKLLNSNQFDFVLTKKKNILFHVQHVQKAIRNSHQNILQFRFFNKTVWTKNCRKFENDKNWYFEFFPMNFFENSLFQTQRKMSKIQTKILLEILTFVCPWNRVTQYRILVVISPSANFIPVSNYLN